MRSSVFRIIDAYDALTTDRHYRKKYFNATAFEIITEGIGTQFMPALTEKVLSIIKNAVRTWHPGWKQLRKITNTKINFLIPDMLINIRI